MAEWPSGLRHGRASAWSSYFHRSFGHRLDFLTPRLTPLPCERAVRSLARLVGQLDVLLRPRNTSGVAVGSLAPYLDAYVDQLVTHSLAQIVASGFIPRWKELQRFVRLAQRGLSPGPNGSPSSEEALLRYLLDTAARLYPSASSSAPPSTPAPTETITPPPPVDPGVHAPTPGVRIFPTRLTLDGSSLTSIKEAWVERPVSEVLPALDPRTWPDRSAFFVSMDPEDERALEAPEPGQSWSGQVCEVFELDWNTIHVVRFETTLDVDVTIGPGQGRTDFTLVYEKNDALLRDDGQILIESARGFPGWTRYYAVKTMRFASATMNMLAPATASLWSDEQIAGFLLSEKSTESWRARWQRARERQAERRRSVSG